MLPGLDDTSIHIDSSLTKRIADLQIRPDELPKNSFLDTFNKDESSVIDDILSESFNHSMQNESIKELKNLV
jgi:hypothetical protein